MIGALIIVFREVLEAALVIGIVAAAVEGLPHRGRLVAVGVGLGIFGAALVASGIDVISGFAQGTGQELFGASVSFGAGIMLAWHNVWMAEHGRQITARLKTLGADVMAGRASVAMLLIVTALAVMREGSEVALFLYGVAASGVKSAQLLTGSLLGLACGGAAGFVLFAGLSRIPIKQLFQVSGAIILLIASGLIGRGVAFLVQAGYVPALIPRVWDSSNILSGEGVIGRSLDALVGYTPAPSLMQVLAWVVSFTVIGGLMVAKSDRFAPKHARAAG
jgi:high-affinity iron transporter